MNTLSDGSRKLLQHYYLTTEEMKAESPLALSEITLLESADDCQKYQTTEMEKPSCGLVNDKEESDVHDSKKHGSGTNFRLFCHFSGISSF